MNKVNECTCDTSSNKNLLLKTARDMVTTAIAKYTFYR